MDQLAAVGVPQVLLPEQVVAALVVPRHPTTDGDSVEIGELIAARVDDDPKKYSVAVVERIEGDTLHVLWYHALNGKNYHRRDRTHKDAFGEVEKGAILSRGHILTTEGRLKKVSEREILIQLEAEETDRMLAES